MDLLHVIIRVLMNVCLFCGEAKMQCICHLTSSEDGHLFRCSCGGRINYFTNRVCCNCMDHVTRVIDIDNGNTTYRINQGECQNCGLTGFNNVIHAGWCMECRDIDGFAEQNRLAGCPIDEDEVNSGFITAVHTDNASCNCTACDEYEAKCQAQYAEQTGGE